MVSPSFFSGYLKISEKFRGLVEQSAGCLRSDLVMRYHLSAVLAGVAVALALIFSSPADAANPGRHAELRVVASST
ncbi:hypothetical protein MCEMSEM23_00816 [Rhabdaerophilaceae bacterium]